MRGQHAGAGVQCLYEIIIGDPAAVAQSMKAAMDRVKTFRCDGATDAFYFNWQLRVEKDPQNRSCRPTKPWLLSPQRNQAPHSWQPICAGSSGIVAGNVKEHGIRRSRRTGCSRDPCRSGYGGRDG